MEIIQRFTDLFVSPTQAFQNLGSKPFDTKNVILGVVIFLLVVGSFSWMMTSDTQLKNQMVSERSAAIEKAQQKGLISKEAAEIEIKKMEAQITLYGEIWGTISYVLVGIFMYFVAAFYIFIVGRFFGSIENFTYFAALSINTVLLLFNALQTLVTDSLFIIYGNFHTTLGLSLLLDSYDAANLLHVLMSKMDVFAIVYLFLLFFAFRSAVKMKSVAAVLATIIPFIINLGFISGNVLLGK